MRFRGVGLRIGELPTIPVIAIVDDDDSVRAATTCLMRSLGYVVHSFASAEDFLQSPHLDDISCLIADVQMPGMSGIELQAVMAESGRHIPVIFITAFPEERIKQRAQTPDTVCFLSKPFDSKVLVGCLETALRKNDRVGEKNERFGKKNERVGE
jgi:FixJ family two-component response regulator